MKKNNTLIGTFLVALGEGLEGDRFAQVDQIGQQLGRHLLRHNVDIETRVYVPVNLYLSSL